MNANGPERIVCLSAEAADWLWRIGTWERVAGATAFFKPSADPGAYCPRWCPYFSPEKQRCPLCLSPSSRCIQTKLLDDGEIPARCAIGRAHCGAISLFAQMYRIIPRCPPTWTQSKLVQSKGHPVLQTPHIGETRKTFYSFRGHCSENESFTG
jgi:hypothetical protein